MKDRIKMAQSSVFNTTAFRSKVFFMPFNSQMTMYIITVLIGSNLLTQLNCSFL